MGAGGQGWTGLKPVYGNACRLVDLGGRPRAEDTGGGRRAVGMNYKIEGVRFTAE